MPLFGTLIGFFGTVGGIAMVIHGFSVKQYTGDWGVLEGFILILMSLVVFAALRPK